MSLGLQARTNKYKGENTGREREDGRVRVSESKCGRERKSGSE